MPLPALLPVLVAVHITPVLHYFYWLPVQQRVSYKLAVMVYRSIRGLIPSNIADGRILVTDSSRRHLRFTHLITLVVPKSRTGFSDRCFAVAGPRLWNNFPAHLRLPGISFDRFERELKAFLFE
jgi:hypothetical protein